MDLLTTVVVLLIAVALIGWVAAAIDGRPLQAFGSGFVGYRSYGWPHGVQEEDAIHSHRPPGTSVHRSTTMEPGALSDPELIELDDATSPSVFWLERLRWTRTPGSAAPPADRAFCASLLQTAVLRCGRGRRKRFRRRIGGG